MTPVSNISEFTITKHPSSTYRLENDRVSGVIKNEIEALKQAISKILQTERYVYPVYSFNYGIETTDLLGKSMLYVKTVISQRIREALLQDDRISDVDTFSFEESKRSLYVRFVCHSVYGDIESEGTINV